MFKYLLFQIGHVLVNILPLSVSKYLTRILCDCHYLFSHDDRRYVQKNLRMICGERPDIPELSREVFRNFGLYLIEFFRLQKMLDDKYIEKHVILENVEALKKVVESNQGAILLGAHMGNWEYGGALMGKFGYPLTIIALPHNEQPLNNYFNKQRMMAGNHVVKTDQALRVCTQVLKQKGIVGLAADRDFTDNGDVLEFLGH